MSETRTWDVFFGAVSAIAYGAVPSVTYRYVVERYVQLLVLFNVIRFIFYHATDSHIPTVHKVA